MVHVAEVGYFLYYLFDTWLDEVGFNFLCSFCFVCELMELCS